MEREEEQSNMSECEWRGTGEESYRSSVLKEK